MPKVIDFGVAKAIEQRLTERTLVHRIPPADRHTRVHEPRAGDVDDSDVDTRSDIYSLGVLLYELLVGATPFDPRQLRSRGYDEICRVDPRDRTPHTVEAAEHTR